MVPKGAQDYRIILHLFKLFSKTQSDRILAVIWRLALCVKKLVRNVSESFTGKGEGRHSPKLWTAKYLSFVICFCSRGLFSMTSLSKYFIQMSARQYHHVDRQKTWRTWRANQLETFGNHQKWIWNENVYCLIRFDCKVAQGVNMKEPINEH